MKIAAVPSAKIVSDVKNINLKISLLTLNGTFRIANPKLISQIMNNLSHRTTHSTTTVERITTYQSTYETFTAKEETTSQNLLKTIMKNILSPLLKMAGKKVLPSVFTLIIGIILQTGVETQNPSNNQINTKPEIQKKINPAPKRKNKNVRQSKNLKKNKTQKQKHKANKNTCFCK